MEQVLTNLNTLNRNLESAVAVGKEFESVEELWSRFEGVMGRGGGSGQAAEGEGRERGGGQGQGQGQGQGEGEEQGEDVDMDMER